MLVPTVYTYDPAGHLASIDDGTPADAVSFTVDALGRHATQTVGTSSSVTTTYGYLGAADTVTSITASGTTIYSANDSMGDRLSSGSGSAFAFVIADLHGNVVAAIAPGSAPSFVNAYRYDAYGETICSYT